MFKRFASMSFFARFKSLFATFLEAANDTGFEETQNLSIENVKRFARFTGAFGPRSSSSVLYSIAMAGSSSRMTMLSSSSLVSESILNDLAGGGVAENVNSQVKMRFR